MSILFTKSQKTNTSKRNIKHKHHKKANKRKIPVRISIQSRQCYDYFFPVPLVNLNHYHLPSISCLIYDLPITRSSRHQNKMYFKNFQTTILAVLASAAIAAGCELTPNIAFLASNGFPTLGPSYCNADDRTKTILEKAASLALAKVAEDGGSPAFLQRCLSQVLINYEVFLNGGDDQCSLTKQNSFGSCPPANPQYSFLYQTIDPQYLNKQKEVFEYGLIGTEESDGRYGTGVWCMNLDICPKADLQPFLLSLINLNNAGQSFVPASEHYLPTKQCTTDLQKVTQPETFCSDSAPACTNVKLARVTLGSEAPFEIAFCDDSCNAPGEVTSNLTEDEKIEYIRTRVNGMGSDNPFCIPFDAPVQVEITGDFDSATYCQTTRPTAGNVCPCVDNPRFEFELKNVTDTVQNCAWLTTKKSKVKARKDAYCLQYANRYACAKSCGTCGTVEPPKSSCDTSTTTKSTKAPKSTTKAPKKSTKAPKSTTKAPKSTTKAPKSTTKAPKSTTKAPAATPQGGSPANSSSGSSNDVEMAATVASAAMAALVLFGVY